jgi:predicted transcriptional regulator
MPPTTLKLTAELKQRIQAAAKASGTSPHAFMLAALERETHRAEQRRGFIADALAARAEVARSGTGFDAAEVHAHLRARAAGRRTTKPRARRWRG